MATPKEVGERSEGQILASFLKAGEVVVKPFGDSQRYDLVLDRGGAFLRIQCKTGRLSNGSITFNTCSTNWNTGTRRNYRGEADFFAVYEPTAGTVYLIPVASVGIKQAQLRVTAAKNGQSKGVRLASDYLYRGP